MLIFTGIFRLFHTRWDLPYFSILIVRVDTLFYTTFQTVHVLQFIYMCH